MRRIKANLDSEGLDLIAVVNGTLVFQLWRHFRCLNFSVHDPLMIETRYVYEALHDPNLHPYFNRPHIKELMRRMGFISADGYALCGIMQFNAYRLYLDQLYRACIKKNLQIKVQCLCQLMHHKIRPRFSVFCLQR